MVRGKRKEMKLAEIQHKLKVPKSKSAGGRFKFRSVEDIYEAVKPLLGDLQLTISDEVVEMGNKFFIRATASLHTTDGKDGVGCTGWAEIPDQKGMNAAQATGSASSYARKYALGGLFLLDDSVDADELEGTGADTGGTPVGKKKINDEYLLQVILPHWEKGGYTGEDYDRILSLYNLTKKQKTTLDKFNKYHNENA